MSDNKKTSKTGGLEKKSFLIDKKVRIEPIANGGAFKDLLVEKEKAKSQAFLFQGVHKTMSVPLDSMRGGLVQVLDDKVRYNTGRNCPEEGWTEQEFFEDLLEIDLSRYSKTSAYLIDERTKVSLENRAYILDLSDPWDYLKWKIMLANKKHVAPSFDKRFDRPSYKFCLIDEALVSNKKRDNFNEKKDAYSVYEKMQKTKEALEDFIKSMGNKKLPSVYTKDWLEEEIEAIIEESPAKFNEIVEDPNFNTKVFIYEAVDCGALNKSKALYSLDSGKEVGNLKQTVAYFNDSRNQELKIRLQGLIENAKS